MKRVAMVRLLSRASVKKNSRRVKCPNQINGKPIPAALCSILASSGLPGPRLGGQTEPFTATQDFGDKERSDGVGCVASSH